MAAQTRKYKIHGIEVEQVSYQGKWYTGVASRIQIAEQADPDTIRKDGHGYHVVSVQIIPVADRWAYHCMVEYPVGSGVVRPGTDFIDLADKAGVAKAETSAIGRALGLHGIAIEEGIASAEEMSRAKRELREDEPPQGAQAQTTTAPAAAVSRPLVEPDDDATPEQRDRMRKYREALELADEAAARADDFLTVAQAEARISYYISEWQKAHRAGGKKAGTGAAR